MNDPAPAWKRPRPLIGDATSAAERAADPAGWAFPADAIENFDRVVAARRDIRRFRPDPIPEETLRQILNAGHQAPSVGHSQPWRFIVVRSQATRDHAAWLADRARLRQADKMNEESARKLLDLKLDGIREAPVGVVLACDRRTHSSGILGRDTFTESDVWSCACAIENMWLAARARGVGMGWVTLFKPEELTELVKAPDGVETLGWLCFGFPDERPPEPGLQRFGWSKKLHLDDVIFDETWQQSAQVTAPADHGQNPTAPSPQTVVSARDQADNLLTPPGSLGVLDKYLDRITASYDTTPQSAILNVALADHKVADLGVTAFSRSVNQDVLNASRSQVSLGAATAQAAGIDFIVTDCGTSMGDLASTPTMTEQQCEELWQQGINDGNTYAGSLVAVGEVGMGNTTVGAALATALLELDIDTTIGLGASADSKMLERKRHVIRAGLERISPDASPREVLREVGGPEVAYLAGLITGATNVGCVVVLDGLVTTMAGVLAVKTTPSIAQRLVAGQRSRETAHHAALSALGLEPLLDIRLRCGEGVGAALATQTLLAGLAMRQKTARTH